MTGILNVLFLCTGNSSRSIMAEALLNYHGARRFNAFSAGTHPMGYVHPFAQQLLRGVDLPAEGARSKSVREFCEAGAPAMDFVLVLCSRAAEEPLPLLPGTPLVAQWTVEDPAAVQGDELEQRQAFREAFRQIENRIKIFCSLRLDSTGLGAIKSQVEEIGRGSAAVG